MIDDDKLISLVYVRKPLWETKHESYHIRDDIKNMWDEIAREMGYASQTLNMRWSNLRKRFQREYDKSRTLRGDGADDKYHSRWRKYKQLLFLADAGRNMDKKCIFKDNKTATSEVPNYLLYRNPELQVKKVMTSTEDIVTQAIKKSLLEREQHRHSGGNENIRKCSPMGEKLPEENNTTFKDNTTDNATASSELGEQLQNVVARNLKLQVKKAMVLTEGIVTQANEKSWFEREQPRYSEGNMNIRKCSLMGEILSLLQDHATFKDNATTDNATVSSESGEQLQNVVARNLKLQVKKAIVSTEGIVTQANEKSTLEREQHRYNESNENIRKCSPIGEKLPLLQDHGTFKDNTTTDNATASSESGEQLQNDVFRNLRLQVKKAMALTEDIGTQANEKSSLEREQHRFSGGNENIRQCSPMVKKLPLLEDHATFKDNTTTDNANASSESREQLQNVVAGNLELQVVASTEDTVTPVNKKSSLEREQPRYSGSNENVRKCSPMVKKLSLLQDHATFKDNTTIDNATASSASGEQVQNVVGRNLELPVKQVMASTEDTVTQVNKKSWLEREQPRYSGSNENVRKCSPMVKKLSLLQEHATFKYNATIDNATASSASGEQVQNVVGRNLELPVKQVMASTEDTVTQVNKKSSLGREQHKHSGGNENIRKCSPKGEKLPEENNTTFQDNTTTDNATASSESGEQVQNVVGRNLRLHVKKAMASTEGIVTQANEKSSLEREQHRFSGGNENIRKCSPMGEKRPEENNTTFKDRFSGGNENIRKCSPMGEKRPEENNTTFKDRFSEGNENIRKCFPMGEKLPEENNTTFKDRFSGGNENIRKCSPIGEKLPLLQDHATFKENTTTDNATASSESGEQLQNVVARNLEVPVKQVMASIEDTVTQVNKKSRLEREQPRYSGRNENIRKCSPMVKKLSLLQDHATFKDNTTTDNATTSSESGEQLQNVVARNLELPVKQVMASTEDTVTQVNKKSRLEREQPRYSGRNENIRKCSPMVKKLSLLQEHATFKDNVTIDNATASSESGEQVQNVVARNLELPVKQVMASTEDTVTQVNKKSRLEREQPRYSGRNENIRKCSPMVKKLSLLQDHATFIDNTTTDNATASSEQVQNVGGRNLELQKKKLMASTEGIVSQANEESSRFERKRPRYSGTDEENSQFFPVEEKLPSLGDLEQGSSTPDYHFLMSLLPHLLDVPKKRKLEIRQELLQVLIDEESHESDSIDNPN